jgi:hypothetical protein
MLGVQFAEMVLRVMPQGPQAVEAADGIDALESLQFRRAPELLQLKQCCCRHVAELCAQRMLTDGTVV